MATQQWFVVIVLTGLVLSGCATTGTAVGEVPKATGGSTTVTLVWKSEATTPERGKISGTMPDGTHYSGKYFQVIAGYEQAYGPAWQGWPNYWYDWPTPWDPTAVNMTSGWPQFVKIYSGRVIANLQADDDSKRRLRCRFVLERPMDGLAGGGIGECQSSTGEVIQDVSLNET